MTTRSGGERSVCRWSNLFRKRARLLARSNRENLDSSGAMRFEPTIPEQKVEIPSTTHHYLGRIATPSLSMQRDEGDSTVFYFFLERFTHTMQNDVFFSMAFLRTFPCTHQYHQTSQLVPVHLPTRMLTYLSSFFFLPSSFLRTNEICFEA